jgi:hypothetical protein
LTIFIIIILALIGLLIAVFILNQRLEKRLVERERAIVIQDQESERMRQHYESEKTRIYNESQLAVTGAQKLIDQQFAEMNKESERIRQHLEAEARRAKIEMDAVLSKTLKEIEPLRRFEALRDAEAETQRLLSEAMSEATALRTKAQDFLKHSRNTAAEERSAAMESVKSIHSQADARLNQALREAGRIVATAEKRSQQIAGDAYTALRDKQMLEQAAEAMRNIIEGYGDRYLVPTHSLLDDLAAEYGYNAAGQSLASAREQTQRMVEQGEAATCEYAEASRRVAANQFVIHAFNGNVDAILSRTKSDNFGILEQKIRDCFSLVNRDGSAFRNARILPAYLDARLAELKWAVVVQELAQRDREEQRYLKEQERDRQKAEQERQRVLREAEREKELIQAAMEDAEKRFATASAEQKAESEREVQKLRQELEEVTRRELTIAQQTSKGRIYVISNVGSFGENVYKIGLTRRQASERVDELSSASVPFEFDIHAVIETENAPVLEYKIHHQFLPKRINKVNLRKEFFRVTLDEIRQALESMEHGKDFVGAVAWTERAKAQQYYDSLNIERDSEAQEKWIKSAHARAQLWSERRERLERRRAFSNGDNVLIGEAESSNPEMSEIPKPPQS